MHGGGILLCGRGGRVGGAQQRSKKGRMGPGQTRPAGPGRAGWWETGSRDRKRDKDWEIDRQRQTEKEGDREICSSSWKTFYQSLFGWFDLGSSLGKRGRWEGLGAAMWNENGILYIERGGGSIVISPNCFLLLLVVAYIIQVYVCTYNF